MLLLEKLPNQWGGKIMAVSKRMLIVFELRENAFELNVTL